MCQATTYEADLKTSTVSACMSVEFGMLGSFNIKCELWHYRTKFGTTCKSETVFDVLKSELDKKKQKLTYMRFEVENIENYPASRDLQEISARWVIENRNKIYF